MKKIRNIFFAAMFAIIPCLVMANECTYHLHNPLAGCDDSYESIAVPCDSDDSTALNFFAVSNEGKCTLKEYTEFVDAGYSVGWPALISLFNEKDYLLKEIVSIKHENLTGYIFDPDNVKWNGGSVDYFDNSADDKLKNLQIVKELGVNITISDSAYFDVKSGEVNSGSMNLGTGVKHLNITLDPSSTVAFKMEDKNSVDEACFVAVEFGDEMPLDSYDDCGGYYSDQEDPYTDGKIYIIPKSVRRNGLHFCDTKITLTDPKQTAIVLTNSSELMADQNCIKSKYGLKISATKGALNATTGGDLSYIDMSSLHPTHVPKDEFGGKNVSVFKPWSKRLPIAEDKLKLKVPDPLPIYFEPIRAAKTKYCTINKDLTYNRCDSISEQNISDIIKLSPDGDGYYKEDNVLQGSSIKEESGVFYYGILSVVEVEKVNGLSITDETKHDIVRIIPKSYNISDDGYIAADLNCKTEKGNLLANRIFAGTVVTVVEIPDDKEDINITCEIDTGGIPIDTSKSKPLQIELMPDELKSGFSRQNAKRTYTIALDSNKLSIPKKHVSHGITYWLSLSTPELYSTEDDLRITIDFASMVQFRDEDIISCPDGVLSDKNGNCTSHCADNSIELWHAEGKQCGPKCEDASKTGVKYDPSSNDCTCTTAGFDYIPSFDKCVSCDNIKGGATYNEEADKCLCSVKHMTLKGNECGCDASNNWTSDSSGGCMCAAGHVVKGESCVPDGDSSACSADSDCDDGKVCKDGECSGGDDLKKGFGEACKESSECDSSNGLACSDEKCFCDTANDWYINDAGDGCEYKEDDAVDTICMINGGTYVASEGYCEYNKSIAACKTSGKTWKDGQCIDGDNGKDDPQNPKSGGCSCTLASEAAPAGSMGMAFAYLTMLGSIIFVRIRKKG